MKNMTFGNTIVSVPEKLDWTKTYKAKPVGFKLVSGRPIIKWKIYTGKDRKPKHKLAKASKAPKISKVKKD